MGGAGGRAEPGGQGWAPEIDEIRRTLAAVSPPFRTVERFGVQDPIGPRDSRPLLCVWVRDAYRVLPGLTGRPFFGARS